MASVRRKCCCGTCAFCAAKPTSFDIATTGWTPVVRCILTSAFAFQPQAGLADVINTTYHVLFGQTSACQTFLEIDIDNTLVKFFSDEDCTGTSFYADRLYLLIETLISEGGVGEENQFFASISLLAYFTVPIGLSNTHNLGTPVAATNALPLPEGESSIDCCVPYSVLLFPETADDMNSVDLGYGGTTDVNVNCAE